MASSVRFDASQTKLQNQTNQYASSYQSSSKAISNNSASKPTASNKTNISGAAFSQYNDERYRVSPNKQQTGDSSYPSRSSKEASGKKNDEFKVDSQKQNVVARGRDGNQYAAQLFRSSDEGDSLEDDNYGAINSADEQEDGGDADCGDSDFEPAEQSTRQVIYNYQHNPSNQRASTLGYRDFHEQNQLLSTQFDFDNDTDLLYSSNYRDSIDQKLIQEHDSKNYVPSDYRRIPDNSDSIYRMRNQNKVAQNIAKDGLYNKNNFENAMDNKSSSSNFYSRFDTRLDAPKTEMEFQPRKNTSGDYVPLAKPEPSFQKYEHSHLIRNKYAKQQIDAMERQNLLDSQKYSQPSQAINDFETDVIQRVQSQTTDRTDGSSTMRKFTRNTGPYSQRQKFQNSTGQKSKYPEDDRKLQNQRSRNMSSNSSGESEILIDPEFRSSNNQYSQMAEKHAIEMNEIKNQTAPQKTEAKFETDYKSPVSSNITTVRNAYKPSSSSNLKQEKWQDSENDDAYDSEMDARFKSTGVGFSPDQELARKAREKKLLMQDSRDSPSSSTERSSFKEKETTPYYGERNQKYGNKTSGSERDSNVEQEWSSLSQRQSQQNPDYVSRLNQYNPAFYPQKQQLGKDNKTLQASTPSTTLVPNTTQKKQKKKKEQPTEPNFLLTGPHSHFLDQRSFYRNSESQKSSLNSASASQPDQKSVGSPEALREWFESLSIQDRVNSLTTTYPILVSSIIEAWQRAKSYQTPLTLFQIKKERTIDQSQTEAGLRRRNGQQLSESGEYTIFERVPSENEYYKAYSYVSEGASVREFQSCILKNTRITTNKQELDTLTVASDFVKNTDAFFSLISNATDEKAFSQPVQFVPRNGGAGKPVIETPKWINRVGSNYLGVWIVAVWEESLWAHFNFAKQVNLGNGVRKNDLNQLFEHRTENLQNQEDLAKRWAELNEEGQKKLFDELGKIAKEETPAKFINIYEEHERRQTYSPHMSHHYQNQEELYQLYQQPRFGLYAYQEIPVQTRITNELLRQDFDGGYQSRAMNQYQLLDQQGNLNPQQNKQLMFMVVNNSDVDLKEIIDVASYVSSLELIKYISEIPLTEVNQKNYIRRHHLMRKLHELIQENLRDSIQNQLMNDLLASESINSNKNQANAGDADDKAKKKRKNDPKNKKRKTGQVQQPQPTHKQTYQEKKSSISKSPSREIMSSQTSVVKIQNKDSEFASKQQQQKQVQNQHQFKFESKDVHPGIASTTTSDDQTNTIKKEKKATQHSDQQKQKKNNAPNHHSISQQKYEPQIPPVVDQTAQIQQIRVILTEIVESVCQMEEQRKETELAEANEQQVREKQQIVQSQVSPNQSLDSAKQELEKEEKSTIKSEKSEEEEYSSKQKTPHKEQNDQKQQTAGNQAAQPAAKKRKRATKKKQDAQELINNFMRQLHGDPEEEQTASTKNNQRNKQSNQADQSQTGPTKKGQQQGSQPQNQQKQGAQTTAKSQNLKQSPQQQQQQRQRDQKNQEQKNSTQKQKTDVNQTDTAKAQVQLQNEEESVTVKNESQKDGRTAKKVESDDTGKQVVPQLVLSLSNSSNEKLAVANNRKKMNETKTVQFFTIENHNNIESNPYDPVSGIFLSQSDFAQSKSANLLPLINQTNLETQNEVQKFEPELIKLQDSTTAQSSQSAAPIPPREKISLTEHFLSAQGNYTTAFRDFRTTDDIYENNTNIYENSKVRKIDYFQNPPQQVSLLNSGFNIDQTAQPWLINAAKPQVDWKDQPVEMSTTSVSFTPSQQMSPQISVKSEDQYSEINVQNIFQPPQSQENQLFIQNLSPPLMKINSAFIQPSNQINDFNMFPQQLNFQQNYMGLSFEGQPYYKQQYSTPFQYQNQDPNIKQGYKKGGAPFRPPQNQYMTMPQKQPTANNRSPTNLPIKQENLIQQYPSTESQNLNSRWNNNRGGKSTNSTSLSMQIDNSSSNFKPYVNDQQTPQIPQIRINAPVFDPYHQKQSYQQNNWQKMQNSYQVEQQIEMQNPAMITNQTQFQRQTAMNQKILMGNEKDYYYQSFEEAFYAQFDKNIAQTTKKIQKTIEKFEEERLYVLNKLQEMANKAFPGSKPVLKMFGSLMTGLALETSDMDIAVTGLRIEDRMAMIDDLHALESQVMKWSLVKDLKAIDTASIPVIKASLSLKAVAEEMGKPYTHPVDSELPIDITFDDSPVESVVTQNNSNYSSPYSDYHRQMGSPQMMNNQMSLDPFTQLQSLFSSEFGLNIGNDAMNPFGMDFGSSAPVKLHQGMISCNVLKEYVKTYPCLKEVALLLKRFLAVNNLNSAYQGGISSYSAVLLIVAYMNNFNLHKSPFLTPSRLLMGFLDFYSDCFDPKLYGVNTANGQSYYLLPHANQQMFIIVDPVQPTNNTARNSFRTPDVLSHFRAAFYSLKNLIIREYQKSLEQDKLLRVETESVSQVVENVSQAQYLQNAAPFKTEKPGENQGTRQKQAQHKKIGAQPQQDQVTAKAQEQQHPHQLSSGTTSQTVIAGVQSLSGSIVNNTGLTKHSVAQAFSSVNFVDRFLSLEILKEGADGQTSKDESQKGSGAF